MQVVMENVYGASLFFFFPFWPIPVQIDNFVLSLPGLNGMPLSCWYLVVPR